MWTLRQTDDGWELVDDDGEARPVEVTAEVPAGSDVSLVAAATPPEQMHWQGPINLEGVPTGDGRLAEIGAWTWETPFPFDWSPEDGDHFGRVFGTVWEVERQDDGTIYGRGTFDLNAPATEEFPEGIGLEAARQVDEGLTDNVSIVPDSLTMELRVRAEVIQEIEDDMEAMDDNEVATESDEQDEDGRILLDEMRHDDWLEVTTEGRIRSLGLVTNAAHDACEIELADGLTLDDLRAMRNGTDAEPVAEAEAIAAAAPAASTVAIPSADWYADPNFGATPEEDPRLVRDIVGNIGAPVTIDDAGRIYGHLAMWGTCHVGRDDICLTAPRSQADYAYFATGAVRASCDCPDEFRDIPTGVITMGTGHASLSAGARDAAAHYDDTGTAVADVTAGEDAHGIWVAGELRPGVTEEQVRVLRGSALSGDWRRIGGNLELVAALAVNVPGFPIPRKSVAASAAMPLTPRARSDGHDTLALVAAGAVGPFTRSEPDSPTRQPLTVEAYISDADRRRLARIEQALTPQIAERLRTQVHGHSLEHR